MSIRTEHGFGPSTVEVEWLDDCPKCQHGKAKVTGWSVTKDSLWAGDEAVCSKCGHNFDLLCDADFWEFSGAKQACEEIKGYETCCPECNHEFKTDFVY